MALWPKPHPPTGYEHHVTDTSDEFEAIPSLFQDSNVDTIYDLGGNDAESTDAEIDDEHTDMRLLYHCFHRRAKQKPI